MATLESKDSRCTLVDGPDRARSDTPHPLPSTPGSPFSASFDPNGPIPETPNSIIAPAAALARNPASRRGQEILNATAISTSLSALANQFAAASQALATIQAHTDNEDDVSATSSGLVNIQEAQMRLEQELDSLREQVTRLGENSRRAEKERERDSGGEGIDKEGLETRLTGIEKKVDDLAEAIRMDQARLYARLYNATISTNKQTLMALPMANGKTPQNFPATKGEFEHLTKERYEFMLKSYGVPIKGDTAAKRQTLREFIGLSPPKP